MAARLILIESGTPYDVLELVELAGDVARARSPFLFEIGEVFAVRIEDGDKVTEASARVRAHAGGTTELDLVRK